ncbi:MAG: DUF115 domain-containing protein [Rhabdochlamydiaceae bacterium]|nr:DUF115 domain-containing protein [Rhabdochlamydiaceae bacterium]
MTATQTPHSVVALDPLKGDLSSHQVIFSYGVADGLLYRQLKKWLQQDLEHYLVFIEDDEELFLRMKSSPMFQDPKVRLYFYQEHSEELFKEIAWEFLFLKFTFAASSPYASLKEEKMHELFSQLEYYQQGVNLLASDAQDMGVRVLKNTVANQKKMGSARLGSALEGKCRGMPAILCGAGPSLNAALPLLKELENRALIIAGGSSVAALSASLVRPHFCAHFDPDPPKSRILSQGNFEVPLFYQNRFSSSLLEMADGPLLWMAEGGSYVIERWFQEKYGISLEPFNAGWTVSNFAAAIALMLGCNPIICVGMDFSFPADEMYAQGITESACQKDLILVKDAAGNPVYSKKDWVMSAEWMGAFAAAHPDVRWIHAQEGGLNLSGFERLSFAEIKDQCFMEEKDLTGYVHSLVSSCESTNITAETSIETCKALKESFERTDRAVDLMLELWEKYYPKSPMETGQYALIENDLSQEPAYTCFIEPLWQIWKRPILRNFMHPFEHAVHHLLFIKRAVEANLGAFS